MAYKEILETTAHWADILTASIAVIVFCQFTYRRFKKRARLEKQLKAEKQRGLDKGQRSMLHLMARLSMTEAEVLDAAFWSPKVRPVLTEDDQGRADRILFEYVS